MTSPVRGSVTVVLSDRTVIVGGWIQPGKPPQFMIDAVRDEATGKGSFLTAEESRIAERQFFAERSRSTDDGYWCNQCQRTYRHETSCPRHS